MNAAPSRRDSHAEGCPGNSLKKETGHLPDYNYIIIHKTKYLDGIFNFKNKKNMKLCLCRFARKLCVDDSCPQQPLPECIKTQMTFEDFLVWKMLVHPLFRIIVDKYMINTKHTHTHLDPTSDIFQCPNLHEHLLEYFWKQTAFTKRQRWTLQHVSLMASPWTDSVFTAPPTLLWMLSWFEIKLTVDKWS